MTDNQLNRRPDNYLVWAILTTILCCLPFGVVSIVYSCKVNNLWDAGQEQDAYDAARKAKNWAIASAVSGVVFSILYIVLIVVFGVAFANAGDLFNF
ncbi:MAG: CD225/dispanin family protein [Bacteroidales bacterium]|nr:CD225/dispanin family protein [Bacteroidales bacterium]